MNHDHASPYMKAQVAIAHLKAAVYETLQSAPVGGLKNVEAGRKLGIDMGNVDHEGHIPRTILAMMEAEGVLEQNADTKAWKLRSS